MLLLDGQVHHDTHVIPMGNYVIGVGNYVSVSPSDLGNYLSADSQKAHQQLAQALATYRELGMDRWADNTLARGGSTLPTGVR